MRILGVVTSPRYFRVSEQRLEKIINSNDIFNSIYAIVYEGKISNSQALLLSAMCGAKKEGAEMSIVYPGDKVSSDFDGVILSTPVYFGDRSSVLHNFICDVGLKDKAVGVVSVGAKRNGGQETTNIYSLYDCLDRGSLITGNGPPTAQYGGTGWAGNKMAIVNDDFGIKTSFGTGVHVAKLAKMINSTECEENPNILFIVVTSDKINMSFINKFKKSNINVLNIASKNIKKCIACPVCPNGNLTDQYTCIIRNDDVIKFHKDIVNADCVIFVSGTENRNWQVFVERTRFIRRNNFELSERVYSSISKTTSITDILPLRVMTNMLRQNMFGLPFFKEYGKFSNISVDEYVYLIEKYTRKSKTSRKQSGADYKYESVGYADAKIDEKAYRD